MKHESFLSLFPVRKPVLGMVHLGKLAGQPGFAGEETVIREARRDIQSWQRGGINGLIIENWQETAVRRFLPRARRQSMLRVVEALVPHITVPFGVNVLNNDYVAAFGIASRTGASFIQLDTVVDVVVSDFTYNDRAKAHPFVVDVDVAHLKKSAKHYGCATLPILAGVHPKHYRMLDAQKSLEQSVRESESVGVSGVVITRATGTAPFTETFVRARRVSQIPLGVGSGLSPENASHLLSVADFAIIGTYAKIDGVTDTPVDPDRVRRLMQVVYDRQVQRT